MNLTKERHLECLNIVFLKNCDEDHFLGFFVNLYLSLIYSYSMDVDDKGVVPGSSTPYLFLGYTSLIVKTSPTTQSILLFTLLLMNNLTKVHF